MTTWILLRGLTHEVRHWGNFTADLQARFPGDRILPLELPGAGLLNDLDSPARIEAMADHCHQALAQAGATPPCVLVAMSMGGMIAAAWAQAHPGELAGCVLINTSFGAFSLPHQRLRPRAWPGLLRAALDPSVLARERRILGLVSQTARNRPEVLQAWTAIAGSRPVRPVNALRQVLASARFRAPRQAPIPTLILAGARDGLVSPKCSEAIARHWQCPLRIHPEAGHDLTLDDGPWVAGAIGEWMEGR